MTATATGLTLGTNFREVQGKADLRVFLVNASLDGNKDAFLVFGKRQFGFGKSYYFPRSEAWRAREPDQFVLLCHDIATAMYGAPSKHDVRLCGDILDRRPEHVEAAELRAEAETLQTRRNWSSRSTTRHWWMRDERNAARAGR